MMHKQSIYFEAPYQIALREELLEEPGPEQLLVKTVSSAISAGTELLIYRGETQPGVRIDETIASLPGRFGYPMKYGYSVVGEVIGKGARVAGEWTGRKVFAFRPHESHFTASIDEVFPIPPDILSEDALFFPNMETAVTLALDGKGTMGEQVAVFGQGIVGLLVTALMTRVPLAVLVTFDPL